MKHSIRIAGFALFTALSLSACGPSEEDKQKAAAAAAEAERLKPVPMPTDLANKGAWQTYLGKVVMNNMQNVKTNHPYLYLVPSGDGADQQDARRNQLDNVTTAVQRGVLPGNMMAFGGPDSKLTGDLIVDAFKSAQDGSFKGVVVLFVGGTADSDRVKEGIAKSGAEFRFVEMK
jgi:hypothetical protein